jgi:hypothetical protein
MADSHTFTNQDAVLKDVYDERTMLEQSYQEAPFFGMVEKEIGEDAGGRRYVQAIEFENPGGASADYAKSRLNATTSQYDAFIIATTQQHQYIQVEHRLMLASMKKPESFVKALDQFDRGFKSLGQKISRRMFRTLGGSIGKLAISSTTTTTLSFADDASIFYCQIGMKLAFAAADGTGSLRDGGDTVTITKINHSSRTVTINADLATTVAGVQTTDFVFPDGDFGACLSGLEDWLPVDDRDTRLATSFASVDRSVSETLLGGVFFDGSTTGSLDETIILLNAEVSNFSGMIDTALTNPRQIANLVLTKNSKVRIEASVTAKPVDSEGKVLTVGFKGFRILVGDKSVILMGDRACPETRLYELQMNTWRLWHTGNLINWQGEVYGEPRIKSSRTSDDAEAQLDVYCNLGCRAPGKNGVAKLRAAS